MLVGSTGDNGSASAMVLMICHRQLSGRRSMYFVGGRPGSNSFGSGSSMNFIGGCWVFHMVARLFCKAIEKMEKTEKVKRAEEPVETKAKVVGKIGWEF